MTIHSSHPRKDLIALIEIYKLQVNPHLRNYTELSKHILLKLLWKTICELDILNIVNNDLFFFKDVDHLKEYIVAPTPHVVVREKDVLQLHEKVKNLNYYIKRCGYLVSQSNYDSLDDIIADANYVRQYGSVPSVRRVIKLLNLDVKIKISFVCLMSDRQRKAIQRRDDIKTKTTPSFKINKGTHVITFI